MPETDAQRSLASATSSATQDPPREQLDALFALYNQGKLSVVLEQADALVEIFPKSSTLWQILGAANLRMKRLEQAGNAFTQACHAKPDNAAAHNNLGTVLQAQDKIDQAIAAYQRAISIKPDLADAHYNLGTLLQSKGRYDQAIAAYERTIEITPHDPGAHNNLGALLTDQGQTERAIEVLQNATAANVDCPELHFNLGCALKKQGKLMQAIAAYQRAIVINPNYADAYSNLGVVLREQGKLEDAIAAYQRAVAIKPDHADALCNLGAALLDQGKPEEAIAAYQRAIAVKPDASDAFCNLGGVFRDQGKLGEAVAACQRAIAINPSDADSHWNLSLALLTEGRLALGWREYEWRWKVKELARLRLSGKPLWLGTPCLKGRTILLWGEQGLGDQIQFARYATSISALGARVILEVSDPLARLLSDLKGVSKVVGASKPVPDSEFDFHCPLMSLPLALGTELSTVPDVPRLTTHMQNVPGWAERVPSSMPKIGIAWSGNPSHKNDRNRSVALSQLAPILTPYATWISLQKEVRDADRPTFDAVGGIHHFGADLLDTAALCEYCDLVISVDTSIAHLAATLGRPVWLLLPFTADWRWLRDRDDSPWYPTMKLYRQQQIGEWHDVFRRVKGDLQAWL